MQKLADISIFNSLMTSVPVCNWVDSRRAGLADLGRRHYSEQVDLLDKEANNRYDEEREAEEKALDREEYECSQSNRPTADFMQWETSGIEDFNDWLYERAKRLDEYTYWMDDAIAEDEAKLNTVPLDASTFIQDDTILINSLLAAQRFNLWAKGVDGNDGHYEAKEENIRDAVEKIQDISKYIPCSYGERDGVIYFDMPLTGGQISFHLGRVLYDEDSVPEYTPEWSGIRLNGYNVLRHEMRALEALKQESNPDEVLYRKYYKGVHSTHR